MVVLPTNGVYTGSRQLHLSHSKRSQQIAKVDPPGVINAWLNERTLKDVCFTQVAVTCATHSTSKGSQEAIAKGCPKGKVSSACLRTNVDNIKLGQLDIQQGGPIRVFYVPSIKVMSCRLSYHQSHPSAYVTLFFFRASCAAS